MVPVLPELLSQKMLLAYGFHDLTLCDRQGILCSGDPSLNWMQEKMTQVTNLSHKTGTLADAMKGADIFVGVSAPGIINQDMVRSMAKDSILFTMANPDPEILPHLAKEAGAKVVGTGRSDFPNQVNNVLVFPGIFKGALEGHATHITSEMKLAAAHAIAGLVPQEELSDNNILPHAFDPQIADVVSAAVKEYIDQFLWNAIIPTVVLLKNILEKKLYKICLDGGFTCPNRDGTLATGGCIFCSEGGSGEFTENASLSVSEQIRLGKAQTAEKYHGEHYIAYFQAFTNTYAPIERLRALYEEAIEAPEIVALSIGTRPDCLSPEVLSLLKELNKRKPVFIEMGLQTAHDHTAAFLNRAYPTETFTAACHALSNAGIRGHRSHHSRSSPVKQLIWKSKQYVI